MCCKLHHPQKLQQQPGSLKATCHPTQKNSRTEADETGLQFSKNNYLPLTTSTPEAYSLVAIQSARELDLGCIRGEGATSTHRHHSVGRVLGFDSRNRMHSGQDCTLTPPAKKIIAGTADVPWRADGMLHRRGHGCHVTLAPLLWSWREGKRFSVWLNLMLFRLLEVAEPVGGTSGGHKQLMLLMLHCNAGAGRNYGWEVLITRT